MICDVEKKPTYGLTLYDSESIKASHPNAKIPQALVPSEDQTAFDR